jgi:hypothetical protein
VLKVEVGAWFVLRDHPRESGLAALAGTQESRDWVNPENTGNALERVRTGDHTWNISLKIVISSKDFQGNSSNRSRDIILVFARQGGMIGFSGPEDPSFS